MVYTLEELRARVTPVAEKYGLRAVYVFGSYARNEATEDSDVDLLIDRAGSAVKTLFDLGGLYAELCAEIGKKVDMVTDQTLQQASARRRMPAFAETVRAERVKLYG